MSDKFHVLYDEARAETKEAVWRVYTALSHHYPDDEHGADKRERLLDAFNEVRSMLNRHAYLEGFVIDFCDPEEVGTTYGEVEFINRCDYDKRAEYIGVSAFKAIKAQMRAEAEPAPDGGPRYAEIEMEHVRGRIRARWAGARAPRSNQ